MGRRPIIVAHRGLHHVHPENSLSAFKAAWDAGIVWCECDVHLSADGTPYILHDDTLDRTTDGSGTIIEMRDSPLQNVKLKNGESIPSLADLAAAMPKDSALLLEMKSPAKLASRTDIFAPVHNRRWMYQSFDAQNVAWAARTLNGVSTCLLVEKQEIDRPMDCQCDAVHVEFSALNETVVAPLRAAGKQLGAWTVNDPDDIRKMLRLGIDMIITDEPILAATIARDEFGER